MGQKEYMCSCPPLFRHRIMVLLLAYCSCPPDLVYEWLPGYTLLMRNDQNIAKLLSRQGEFRFKHWWNSIIAVTNEETYMHRNVLKTFPRWVPRVSQHSDFSFWDSTEAVGRHGSCGLHTLQRSLKICPNPWMEQEFHCGEGNGNKAGEGRRSGGVLRTDQQSALSEGGEPSPGENLQPHPLQWWAWKLGRAGMGSEPTEAPEKDNPWGGAARGCLEGHSGIGYWDFQLGLD